MPAPRTLLLRPVRTAVVEPVHGPAGVRYRLARSPGLVETVRVRLDDAVLRLAGAGGGTLVGAHGAEPLRMAGSWHTDPGAVRLHVRQRAADGSWHTVDGVLAHDRLTAVLCDNRAALVAHVTAHALPLAGPGVADEPVIPPDPDPGLPNAAPVSPLDVDQPVYDGHLQPEGQPAHPARLLLAPADDGTFSLDLVSLAAVHGAVNWVTGGLSRAAHIAGPRVRVRWPAPATPMPGWHAGPGQLELAAAEMELDFDAATHTVRGRVVGTGVDGTSARAVFTGTLCARDVQRLRERIAHPDPGGRWVRAWAPTADGGAVLDVAPAPGAEPRLVSTAAGPLRHVPALDLLVGPGAPDADEPVLLHRVPGPDPELPTDPEARSSLRLLGQDLVLAFRFTEARPLLRCAEALVARAAAAPRPMPGAAEYELVSLVKAVSWQVRCAIVLRDHQAMLAHLEHAVARLDQLADERYAHERCAPVAGLVEAARQNVEGPLGLAETLHRAAADAGDPVAEPAARLAGQLRAAATLLAAVELDGAGLPAIERLERDLAAAGSALRELAGRCPPGSGPPELVRERDALVAAVDGSVDFGPAELAEITRRDHDWEQRVRAAMGRPEAELFVLTKDAAVAMRGAAALLALGRTTLHRADPVRDLDTRRARHRATALRLTGFVEQWRRALDDDWHRILATEQASGFYQRLVAMMLDLQADEEAWVASELARARATADLLGAADEPLRGPTLRAAVAALGQVVVEYYLRPDELVIWVVPPVGELRCVRHPVGADELVDAVDRVHRLLDGRTPAAEQRAELAALLRELAAHLWDPLPADALPPGAAVTVVPHRELGLVPFAGLRTSDGAPLVRRHELTVLPAVALLPALLRRGRPGAFGGPLLALVDPHPMPEPLRPLPRLRAGFAAVRDLFDGGTVWTGEQATPDRLRAARPRPAVVVLATHGVPDEDGWIALAGADGHDGRVRAAELFELDLPGSVVLLAACHAGGGRPSEDGLAGLSRAVLVGGASTLIMSVHETTDDAALAVVHGTLRRWRDGATIGAAFRAAQLELADEHGADPALWIPFTRFGLG